MQEQGWVKGGRKRELKSGGDEGGLGFTGLKVFVLDEKRDIWVFFYF